jgi:hypothetical protein
MIRFDSFDTFVSLSSYGTCPLHTIFLVWRIAGTADQKLDSPGILPTEHSYQRTFHSHELTSIQRNETPSCRRKGVTVTHLGISAVGASYVAPDPFVIIRRRVPSRRRGRVHILLIMKLPV